MLLLNRKHDTMTRIEHLNEYNKINSPGTLTHHQMETSRPPETPAQTRRRPCQLIVHTHPTAIIGRAPASARIRHRQACMIGFPRPLRVFLLPLEAASINDIM
jgi:hypothetical protein